MTRATLRRVTESSAQPLLTALRQAFHADTSLGAVPRADSLPVTAAILGVALEHGAGSSVYAGEFTSDRPGDWIVTKLFLGDGETEVFLALNPRANRAQLIAKDPEYANGVVAELARLF